MIKKDNIRLATNFHLIVSWKIKFYNEHTPYKLCRASISSKNAQSSSKNQAWTQRHLLWHCYQMPSFLQKSIIVTTFLCGNISLSAASKSWHTRTDRCFGFTSSSTYLASHYTSYSSANYSSALESWQNAICFCMVIKTNTVTWKNYELKLYLATTGWGRVSC